MASNKITVNIQGLGPIDITHHIIKSDSGEMTVRLTEENVKNLKAVEPILKENGLTINDLLVSLIKYIIENKEKVEAFCAEMEGEHND